MTKVFRLSQHWTLTLVAPTSLADAIGFGLAFALENMTLPRTGGHRLAVLVSLVFFGFGFNLERV